MCVCVCLRVSVGVYVCVRRVHILAGFVQVSEGEVQQREDLFECVCMWYVTGVCEKSVDR